MNAEHPWKLVAPWYHWLRQRDDLHVPPRQTRPVFQKFDAPDFVKGFVRDPQHSLKFVPEVDTVYRVSSTPITPPTTGIFANKLTRLLTVLDRGKKARTLDTKLVPTTIRKLYLETHQRHYLVVCELHCDAAGFPTAKHEHVCQAGFVVRRRSLEYPQGLKKDAASRLQTILGLQTEIAYWEQTSPARGRTASRRARAILKLKAEDKYDIKVAGLHAQLVEARKELTKWKDANGIVPVLEGWVAGAFANVGGWQMTAEKPQEIAEAYFPLYHLYPDPNIPDHTARGKNIYFGVVPTSTLDTDARGNPRFGDDPRLDRQPLYEIRCFVRRHKEPCPRRDEAPDCHGEVFWSEPTEQYRLASPNDLIGTSQRPVTIQMPDLAELAAQAAALPLNQFAPMKVVQPQQLNFDVSDGKGTNGKVGGFPQICFFAIPLITIVAFFVLRLFLPILVFLFNLYFLLAFKFCILPSVDIDADMNAKLDVLPGGIDVDAELDVSIGFSAGNLHDALKAGIAKDAGDPTVAARLDVYSNAALLPLGKRVHDVNKVPEADADNQGVNVTAGLEYEARVEVTGS